MNPSPGSKSHQHEREAVLRLDMGQRGSCQHRVVSVAQVTGKGRHICTCTELVVDLCPTKMSSVRSGQSSFFFLLGIRGLLDPRLACSTALPGSFKPPAHPIFCPGPPVAKTLNQGCRLCGLSSGDLVVESRTLVILFFLNWCLAWYDRISARVPQTKIWRPN